MGGYVVCEGTKRNTIRLWCDGIDLGYNDLQHLMSLLAQMRLEVYRGGDDSRYEMYSIEEEGGKEYGKDTCKG